LRTKSGGWYGVCCRRAHERATGVLPFARRLTSKQGAEPMPSSPARQSSVGAFTALLGVFGPAMEYMVDAAQRSVLFWDVMRQRGNQYREHLAEAVPHVLDYDVELILGGKTLARPLNYRLVRVVPPPGIELDPTRRPFVIVDPRAGHGPGIGGFKADSEIGVAFKAGHPCYFIGFLPDPVPGQTIEDIARAEAIFLEKVAALHPEADGKPCVIGNCQAGWAVMMLAAIRPELFGPIIIAGSPLSYWAGVHGKNPMRYSPPSPAMSATASSTAPGWCRTSRTRIPPTRFGPSSTISIPRSTPKRRAISVSSAGGEVTSISTRRRSSSSSTSCSSATISPPEESRPQTEGRSTFATFVLPLSCSARRATTSRRPSRRLDGFSIFTRASTRSAPTGRRSSTRSTRPSVTSASSCPAASLRKSTANFPATST